ncbi:hypothetical protein ACHAXT_009414 [Thalassiosira profunda]
MRTPLLLSAAAAGAVVAAQSHPKTDDPARRILSGAESIDQRLRRGRRRLRSKEAESPSHAADIRDMSGAELPSGSAATRNLSAIRNLSEGEAESSLGSTATRDLSADPPLTEVQPDPRIIGGTLSSPNRYPWLVSLTYAGSHLCGGSLVAHDMVLTAAHCSGYSSAVELGRYDRNIAFDDRLHERIDIAYEIKHPLWDPATVDNDFMLMKLVQPSREQNLVTLNANPDLPSIPGEQLTLMGWGDTNPDPNVNEPSMQLLEIQLEFVPDGTCRDKEGNVGADYVNYASRITTNMMCAMDSDGGRGDAEVDEDTCLGDSGSPMIVPRAGSTDDVQVGIVSWGIGCASPIFPGVYSRVSSQYEWIRETVCRHSANAPEGFECDESSGTQTGLAFPLQEDESDKGKSSVTLEISLDEQPEEFSWLVSTLSGESSQMVASVPPGFYSGYKSYTFHHKLYVDPDEFYRISLRDSFGDGLSGYVAVYRTGIPILSNLLMYEHLFYDKDRTDVKKIDHAFYTGKEAPNYFSLAIKFDKFPKDLWWRLESDTDSVIMAQRPAGYYNERFELMSIVETIPVFGARSDAVKYRFTIGDSYPCEGNPSETCGDGICCNYGEGSAKLYSGAVENDVLLWSGGDYGLSESVLVSAPAQTASKTGNPSNSFSCVLVIGLPCRFRSINNVSVKSDAGMGWGSDSEKFVDLT